MSRAWAYRTLNLSHKQHGETPSRATHLGGRANRRDSGAAEQTGIPTGLRLGHGGGHHSKRTLDAREVHDLVVLDVHVLEDEVASLRRDRRVE